MEAAGVGWSVELGSDRRERSGRRGGRREVAGRMVEEKKLADTPYFVFLRGEDTLYCSFGKKLDILLVMISSHIISN